MTVTTMKHRPVLVLQDEPAYCQECDRRNAKGGIVELAVHPFPEEDPDQRELGTRNLGKFVCTVCWKRPWAEEVAAHKGSSLEFKPLTDKDPFPFGIHKGKPIGQVPGFYLDWLRGQEWIEKWPAIADYVQRVRKHIDKEISEGAD